MFEEFLGYEVKGEKEVKRDFQEIYSAMDYAFLMNNKIAKRLL
jgi:hypothetical protein